MTPPKDQTPTPLHPDRSEMIDYLQSLIELARTGRLTGLRTITNTEDALGHEIFGTWNRGELIYMQSCILAADEAAARADLDAELMLLRKVIEEG